MCSAQTVGVIVRLERENFHVLGMHGKVIECKPTALQKRRENQNTVALDSEQNQIRRRDIVKVLEGPHAGRDGEIKHLYRSLAFLHSRMYTENGGIFVCKTRHLKLAGGNKNTSNTMGINQMGMIGFSVRVEICRRFFFSLSSSVNFLIEFSFNLYIYLANVTENTITDASSWWSWWRTRWNAWTRCWSWRYIS